MFCNYFPIIYFLSNNIKAITYHRDSKIFNWKSISMPFIKITTYKNNSITYFLRCHIFNYVFVYITHKFVKLQRDTVVPIVF